MGHFRRPVQNPEATTHTQPGRDQRAPNLPEKTTIDLSGMLRKGSELRQCPGDGTEFLY